MLLNWVLQIFLEAICRLKIQRLRQKMQTKIPPCNENDHDDETFIVDNIALCNKPVTIANFNSQNTTLIVEMMNKENVFFA